MNRIDIGPNIIASRPNDQSSTPCCFREEEFKVFLLCSYVSTFSITTVPTYDPPDGASFDPRGII